MSSVAENNRIIPAIDKLDNQIVSVTDDNPCSLFLKNCLKCKVGLGEDEYAIKNSNEKFRVLGNKREVLKKKHEEGVNLAMR